MFVDILSNEEKTGLFELLVAIAQADGDISKEENKFLRNYATENNINHDIHDTINLAESCSLIKTPKAKIIALQEVIKIALSDGHYDNEERKGALAISNILSLAPEKFYEIENWVIEGQSWVKKGEKIVASAE